MYKLQKNIWLTVAFIGLSLASFGQTITTSNLSDLSPRNSINKIYESYIFDKEIVLLSDNRTVDDLDILIVVLNQKKEIIREQIIGTKGAYDRPIGLIKKEEGYWLCANSVKNGERLFKIYELDKEFIPINYNAVDIKNLSEVTTIHYDANKENLIFTATIIDALEMYPRLIKYDLANHSIVESIDLDSRNDDKLAINEKKTVPVVIGIDEKTNKLITKGYKEVEQYNALSKECNQIKCINDDCSEMMLIGQEISVNFTDFWVTKIKDNQVVWEKMYKTRLGGDVAMDVFLDKKSKNSLVGGIGYNKMLLENKDHYYHYRVLQLDENGALLNSNLYKSTYKSSTRSMYSQMQQVGDSYLMSGYTQDKTYSGKTFAEDDIMTPSNLYLVLVNKDGTLKTEKVIETQSVDIPYSSVVLSEEKMLLIFSRDERMKILEVNITELN
jgi:hypothetical protein